MDKVGILQHTSINSCTLPIQACRVEKGGFSSDGRVVWVWSRDGGVVIYEASEFSKVGWLDTEGLSLVSSCELRYNGVRLLVLALTDHSRSTVAILSQSSGQLIQAVQLSGPLVTCVCEVNYTHLPGLFATSTLLHFSGVICLGLQNGCVVTLDLGLDGLENQPKASLGAPRSCVRVHVSTSSIVTHLNLAGDKEAQLALELNSQYIKGNKFHYTDSAEQLIATFDKASVSSLLHVPQLCSILIGYSFGGFQIFSFLENFLLFSYPLSTKRLPPPITHFSFQEPENDPKPFVYVWVARNGLPPQGRLGSSPSLTLYQLAFKRKLDEQGLVFYQDMEGCIQRFEHLLWPHPYTSAIMLKCYTIERLLHVGDADSSFSKTPLKSLTIDRTLAVFMCQTVEDGVVEEGIADARGLMVVFDLNQWYHCQMPIFANWLSSENQRRKMCPFLAVYKLSTDGPLLDARISSVSPFSAPPPVPETHLWPESLTINLTSLTASSMNISLYEGVQKLALNQLLSFGADIMIDPERFMSMSLEVDLLESPSAGDTQNYLLSVCLLYQLRSTLMAVVKAVQNPGCRLSLGSLVHWIKTTVNELTTEKTKIFETLGPGSAGVVDQFTLRCVQESHLQLSLLTDLIVELHSGNSLSEDELMEVYNPASVYSEIFQTAHWCMENGLLPHSLDTDHIPVCENAFVFPVAALRERYNELEDRRSSTGLAIDLLIGQLADEESPFKYPPDGIDCLMYSKIYPATVSRYCLDLYVLCDVSPSSDRMMLVESYCKRFAISKDIAKVSHSIWTVDHGTPDTDDAKLLSVYFPTVFELSIKSLIDKGCYSEAVQCLSVGVVSCPRLHLQALVYSGHVQQAYKVLANYEGSEEYDSLLEHFVEHCLTSDYAYKLKRLQLSPEQLNLLCNALKAQGGDEAVHLSLSLLLLHQCNIEAITLAREKGRQGGMLGKCLAYGSTLLPPVKEGMCSEELLRRIHSNTEVPVGPPQSLSAVMPKSHEHHFTSQLDIILAVSKKVAEARNLTHDPLTPLRKNKRLDDTVSGSPAFSSIPFTSSPLPSSQRTRTFRQTPLVHSTWKAPATPCFVPTPGKADRAMGQFLAQMEGFRVRMAKMSGMPKVDRDLDIRTPQIIRLDRSPYHPASILKTIPSFRPSPSEEALTTTSRKIRFAIDDSLEATPGKKSLAVNTPLPESDDSEHFYSPQGSLEPHDVEMDDRGSRPDADEPGANIVIATEGDDVKGSGSFVASAEDETENEKQPKSSSELSKLVTSPSSISRRLQSPRGGPNSGKNLKSSQLTRSSLSQKPPDTAVPLKFHPSPGPMMVLSPRVLVSPLTVTNTTQLQSDNLTPSTRKRSYRTGSSVRKSSELQQEFKKHSGVMVNVVQEEGAKYTFSPPQTVAMVTPLKEKEPSTSTVGSEFVFSPPLLRSASRDRKKAEFKRTGVDKESSLEGTPSSSSSVVTARPPLHGRQQKRVRQVKTTQSTPRRSERLLRTTKK